MAFWYLNTMIETDDNANYTDEMIRKQIMDDMNTGNGIYIEVHDICTLEKQNY